MKIDLGGRLPLAADARPVTDPWGLGWIFLIRPLTSHQWQSRLKKKQRESPLLARASSAMIKAQAKAMFARLSPEARLDQELAATERQELASNAMTEFWSREIDALDLLGFEDMQKLFAASIEVEDIETLVAGWPKGPLDGDGREVPYHDADQRRSALLAILGIDEEFNEKYRKANEGADPPGLAYVIPEGRPYAGKALGEAFRLWIMAAAGDSAAAQLGLLEAASGNSAESSGGATGDSSSSLAQPASN